MANKNKGKNNKLTECHQEWLQRKVRQGFPREILEGLITKQKGRCEMSQSPLLFSRQHGGGVVAGGQGCHPLYASVDHIEPGNPDKLQIVCYALNDLKGHLPIDCFQALQKTKPWKRLMNAWRKQAEVDHNNREAFRNLIRPRSKVKSSLTGRNPN